MDFTSLSMAKLSGSKNYQVWSIKMKSYFIAQDLWSVVQNSSPKSIAEDSMSQNSKVMALIILSCEDHIIRLLNPDESASIAWKKLEN